MELSLLKFHRRNDRSERGADEDQLLFKQ